MNETAILIRLGLTPEIIRRHAVSIQAAAQGQAEVEREYYLKYRRAWRAANVARGLTVEGKPRRRLPNGQRKPRLRGSNARAASVPASQREAGYPITP